MSSWADVERAEPEFAARVKERFDMYRHKVIATLRKDGSPRISGVEASLDNGEVWLGMMPNSLKARDLQRDPRVALHSGTEDPNEEAGMANVVVDAKLSGKAIEVDDIDEKRRIGGAQGGDEPNFHLFKIDISEVVLISIGDPADHMLVETWHEGRGLKSTKRY